MVLLWLHLIHLQQLCVKGYIKSFLGAITVLFVLQADKKKEKQYLFSVSIPIIHRKYEF